MLNNKEREFFTIWLIAYGQGIVNWNSATPMDSMYSDFSRAVLDFSDKGYLKHYVDNHYSLTDKCIKELQND